MFLASCRVVTARQSGQRVRTNQGRRKSEFSKQRMNWNALVNTHHFATVLQHALWLQIVLPGDARELCNCSEDPFKMKCVVLSCTAFQGVGTSMNN